MVGRVLAARALRHAGLAAVTLMTVALVVRFGPGDALDSSSLATAWLCLVFMASAMVVGPRRVLRAGQPVVNLPVRRDLGIWAALTGLAHLFAASMQSMTEPYMTAYVYVADDAIGAVTRSGLFAWGSVIGFVIGLVLLLLALSNNWMLRRLGPKKWKRLQRLAYPAFVLTALHGLMFQLLEFRSVALIALLALLFAVVACAQALGFQAARRGG